MSFLPPVSKQSRLEITENTQQQTPRLKSEITLIITKYSVHTWWFIIARRQSIHKCTSSSASPKFILECDVERVYMVKRFFNRIDWWGFRVSPWRSRASEALCFSEERRPLASANDELLTFLSLCIKLQINIFTLQKFHIMNVCSSNHMY